MAATPPLSAALRSPISSRRFSPIRNAPFHFNVVAAPFSSPSSFTLHGLFDSVAIGGRVFPFSPAAKQQVDQDEVGFDEPPSQELAIASACLVGVLTGISVVLFNNCVHLLRDFSWDGISDRGASWLREEPIGSNWLRVILVPTFGGLIVSILNQIREAAGYSDADSGTDDSSLDRLKAVLRPFLKTVAACVTLGTGNSLGPEGPSVEIGASIAKGVNSLFKKSPQTGFSLLAAGSASGISSGFNAAVAGCFFAVESVIHQHHFQIQLQWLFLVRLLLQWCQKSAWALNLRLRFQTMTFALLENFHSIFYWALCVAWSHWRYLDVHH